MLREAPLVLSKVLVLRSVILGATKNIQINGILGIRCPISFGWELGMDEHQGLSELSRGKAEEVHISKATERRSESWQSKNRSLRPWTSCIGFLECEWQAWRANGDPDW